MNRCTICGRPPSEECCDQCHAAHSRIEKAYREQRAFDPTVARYRNPLGQFTMQGDIMKVKVQIDPRKDGRYTATLKVIALTTNEMRGLIAQLHLGAMGRWLARPLADKFAEILEGRSEQLAELTGEAGEEEE